MIGNRFYLLILLSCSFFIYGCSSTHQYSFKPTKTMPPPAEKILGLPIVIDGITLNESCIGESEVEIDDELKEIWKDQYIPISQTKEKYNSMITPLQLLLSNNSDSYLINGYDVSLKLDDNLCNQLKNESKCRYVVIPRMITQKMNSQTVINVGWFVPAGAVIIYGSFPLPLGLEREEMPVFDLTLLDLETKEIMAQGVYAYKTSIEDDCIEYPTELIDKLSLNSK